VCGVVQLPGLIQGSANLATEAQAWRNRVKLPPKSDKVSCLAFLAFLYFRYLRSRHLNISGDLQPAASAGVRSASEHGTRGYSGGPGDLFASLLTPRTIFDLGESQNLATFHMSYLQATEQL
jgi:hypothetical protein